MRNMATPVEHYDFSDTSSIYWTRPISPFSDWSDGWRSDFGGSHWSYYNDWDWYEPPDEFLEQKIDDREQLEMRLSHGRTKDIRRRREHRLAAQSRRMLMGEQHLSATRPKSFHGLPLQSHRHSHPRNAMAQNRSSVDHTRANTTARWSSAQHRYASRAYDASSEPDLSSKKAIKRMQRRAKQEKDWYQSMKVKRVPC